MKVESIKLSKGKTIKLTTCTCKGSLEVLIEQGKRWALVSDNRCYSACQHQRHMYPGKPTSQLLVFSFATLLACSFLAPRKLLSQAKESDVKTRPVVMMALPPATMPSPPHFLYSLL